MKKVILTLMIVFSYSLAGAQTTLTNDDRTFIKTTRSIKSLETQLEAKREEMRIAVSALRTTFQSDIAAIELQIVTKESELKALN